MFSLSFILVCVWGGRVRSAAHSPASFYCFMGTSRPNPPARPILSYLVFRILILPVWDDFCFCLHSWHGKFQRFDHFPCILVCCFSFLCFLVCVRRGGSWVGCLSTQPHRPPSLIISGTWLDDRWRLPARTLPVGQYFLTLIFAF